MAKEASENIELSGKNWKAKIPGALVTLAVGALFSAGGFVVHDGLTSKPASADDSKVTMLAGDCARHEKAIEALMLTDDKLRQQDGMLSDGMGDLRTCQKVAEKQFESVERRLGAIETSQQEMNRKLDRLLERRSP